MLVWKLTGDFETSSDAGDLLDHDHGCNFPVAECKPGQNVRPFHIHSTSLSSPFGKLFLPDSAHEPFQRESSLHRCIFRPCHGKRLPHRVHLQTERRQSRADCEPPRHREEGRTSQTHARVRAWNHFCPDFRRKLSTFGTKMQVLKQNPNKEPLVANWTWKLMKPNIPWNSAMRKKTPDERLLSIQAKDGGRAVSSLVVVSSKHLCFFACFFAVKWRTNGSLLLWNMFAER